MIQNKLKFDTTKAQAKSKFSNAVKRKNKSNRDKI